jgi:hypothetical protein
MMTPIPGSIVIPTLGVPSTLVSIGTQAVLASAVCVGASLLLAWAVTMLQRRHQPASRSRSSSWETLAERLHLVRHAT